MRQRRNHLILVSLIVAALVGVALIAVPGSPAHKKTKLGLDLQGGLEVVLKAVPPKGHKITPADLEQTYGLAGGHIHHGELALDQIFTMRPLLGWAQYRTPVGGLYLCGAGTHPGGGVTGLPGRNAAREIVKDLR